MKKLFPLLATMVIISIAVGISFFRLNVSAIENWDEAFYADGMRHILIGKSAVVPFWNQAPFLDKPPLHIWLGSIGVRLLGETSVGYRFTSATATFLCLLIVYFYSRSKFGVVPALIAFVTLVSNTIFIWRGRGANTDGLLTLLSLLVFVVYQEKIRGKYILLGFLLSLIYMTKSTVVGFPVLALTILEFIELHRQYRLRDLQIKRKLVDWLSGLLALVTIPGLWLLAGYQQIGRSFIDFYLFQSDYNAASLSLRHFNLNYLGAMATSYGPLFMFVILGIFLAFWRGWGKSRSSQAVSLLVFGLLLPTALTFSSVYYHWYLLPSLPILAILAGYGVQAISDLNLKHNVWLQTGIISLVIFLSGWRVYTQITPLFYADSAYHQAQSGKWLQAHTQPDDVVIRLDEIYPTLILYSERRVLVSDQETQTISYFLSRSDLVTGLKRGTYRWVNGNAQDVAAVADLLSPGTFHIHAVTDQEQVLEITKLSSEQQ